MSKTHAVRNRKMVRRQRAGAVLVEGLLVATVLTGLLAWSIYLHRLTAAKLETLYAARYQAWKTAISGCADQGGFGLKSMVESFKNDELADPGEWFSLSFNTTQFNALQVAATTPIQEDATVRSTTVFPCNSIKPKVDPIGDPLGWVSALFL